MASRGDLQRTPRRGGAEISAQGSKVYLEGQLQTRKWTDQHGQESTTTDVILPPYRGELTILDSVGTPTSMARTNSPGDQSLGSGSHKDTTNPAIVRSVFEDNVQSTELCRTRKAAQASHPIQTPQSDDQLKKKPQETSKSANSTTKRTAKKKPKFWSPRPPKPSLSSPTPKRPAKPGALFIDEPSGLSRRLQERQREQLVTLAKVGLRPTSHVRTLGFPKSVLMGGC